MEKTISAWEARRQFGKLLRDVSRDGEMFVVESHGEPVAAIVPIRVVEAWERDRRALFDDIRATAERVDLSDEEAQEIVARAIERVRSQG